MAVIDTLPNVEDPFLEPIPVEQDPVLPFEQVYFRDAAYSQTDLPPLFRRRVDPETGLEGWWEKRSTDEFPIDTSLKRYKLEARPLILHATDVLLQKWPHSSLDDIEHLANGVRSFAVLTARLERIGATHKDTGERMIRFARLDDTQRLAVINLLIGAGPEAARLGTADSQPEARIQSAAEEIAALAFNAIEPNQDAA